jgi:uncharacterized protein
LQAVFRRSQHSELLQRLGEPRRFLQVLAGPRQVGKTTLIQQVLADLEQPTRYASADEPTLRGQAWIQEQWDASRAEARENATPGAVLVLDEIQKLEGWSETVKRLWDEDTRHKLALRVVLLGSAPLLVQRGLSESLAGRFERIHLPHWSFAEMREAFGVTLEEYVLFGGYPGAAQLLRSPARWMQYVRHALVETTISRDVLLLSRVDKPALLRRLFELACRHSGQILSYTKMLGQLQDAGNTTTLAHYLDLLAGAGMVAGLPRYSGSAVRQRGSIPKIQVLNNALLCAYSGLSGKEIRSDPILWGQFVESAVGAHIANAAAGGEIEVSYWRERNREVDFVVRRGRTLLAIEVKSGRARDSLPGMQAFIEAHRPTRSLLVGADGVGLDEFLASPVERWLT